MGIAAVLILIFLIGMWPRKEGYDGTEEFRKSKKSQAELFRWLGDSALPWQRERLEELEKEGF